MRRGGTSEERHSSGREVERSEAADRLPLVALFREVVQNCSGNADDNRTTDFTAFLPQIYPAMIAACNVPEDFGRKLRKFGW